METSAEIGSIAGALAKAQAEMENAIRDRANPHFKSTYATLAAVVDAVRPVLAKHGIAIVQDARFNGNDVEVVTTLVHGSGQWMKSSPLSSPVAKKDAQGVGSALTYVRRYALMAIAGIAPDDDDGESAVGRGGNHREQARNDPPPRREPPRTTMAAADAGPKIADLRAFGILGIIEDTFGDARGWSVEDWNRTDAIVARIASHAPCPPGPKWSSDEATRKAVIAITKGVCAKVKDEAAEGPVNK